MAQKVNKKKEVEDHDGCDICIAAVERKIIRKCFADADGISIPQEIPREFFNMNKIDADKMEILQR